MAKVLTKEKWRKRRRRNQRITWILLILIVTIFAIKPILHLSETLWTRFGPNNIGKETVTQTLSNGEIVKEEYLTPNPYSRPQKRLRRINGIVVHYTANPGATAENNRNYFENLKDTKETSVSSHFVIGLEGEIIQCIPLTEISYASNDRNDDTVSIECCHPDKTGKFNQATYKSLVSLVAALSNEFNIDDKDIIRHYDVTGKLCPLYFVEHEDAWKQFKKDVRKNTIEE
jgi:N-acetylmuramoyl-L-alanine amidase